MCDATTAVAERDHAADREVEAAREDDDGLADRGEDERQRVVDQRRPLEVAREAVQIGVEEHDVDASVPARISSESSSGADWISEVLPAAAAAIGGAALDAGMLPQRRGDERLRVGLRARQLGRDPRPRA